MNGLPEPEHHRSTANQLQISTDNKIVLY